MAKHLEGKVAIVTGGAGGMGSHVSRVFAEQGAKVVVADTGADVEGRMGMDPSRVDAVVADIRKAGGEAVSYIGDIAEMKVAEELIGVAVNTFGTLDILVCAHGILRERMIFNMSDDEWDGVIRAHLKGCFAPTKFASIFWRAQRTGGRIIYFTSDAGISGGPGQANYSAAQAGKIGLMRSNAQALQRYGVTSNVIAPLAATRMTDRGRGMEGPPPSLTAAGKPMDPKNVAPLLVWLASEEGGAANGKIFGVSGHRISLYEDPVQERYLYTRDPYFDIDKLFDLWPKTIGLQDFPMPEIEGIERQPQG